MKIKVRVSHIFYFIVLTIVICDCNGFRLFSIEDNIYKGISLLMVGIAFTICIFRKTVLNFSKNYGRFILFYLGLLLFFFVFEFFYIRRMYGSQQPFYEFANYNKYYVFVLLTIPLIYIFVINDSVKKIMDGILVIVTITLGLMLLYAFFNNWQKIELFNINIYAKTSMRNGRLRMWDLSSIEGLAIIYGAYRVSCDKRNKLLYLFQVIVCIFSLIYVEQTRMMLIALTISITFMVFLKPYKTIDGILGKYGILFLSGVLGCLFVIPRLITSFGKGVSISYRLIEIQYVYNLLHNIGIFGMGMISRRLQRQLFYYGIYSNVSLEDIGIIGYSAQVGIWGIALYFLPMLRMAWVLLHGEKNDLKIFLWSIYSYLLITSATLLVLDSQRILMWPFCLALFEFYNMKYNKRKPESIQIESS